MPASIEGILQERPFPTQHKTNTSFNIHHPLTPDESGPGSPIRTCLGSVQRIQPDAECKLGKGASM